MLDLIISAVQVEGTGVVAEREATEEVGADDDDAAGAADACCCLFLFGGGCRLVVGVREVR